MFRILFDIRYSVRKLVRTPGLALALLLTIALGIGSNVSIYGFARGLLSRPDTPLTSVDRVVSIFTQDIVHGAGPLSYEEYLLLKNRRSTFEWIGAARVSPISITLADHSAIVSVAAVTPSLARRLNLSLGKGVVISHRMWESEFGGKANIRADQIRINGTNMRVGGVAPNWLEGLYRDRAIDLWVLVQENRQGIDRTSRSFWVLARLRRGVSTTQAQTGIPSSRHASGEIIVLPYTAMTPEMAEGMAHMGTLIGSAAGAVFLIACINVVGFLLGRAFARSHETSLRVALGARRRQLAAQLLWDSIVISVAGGALGTLLAVWTAYVVPALLFEEDAERLVFAPDVFTILAASAACVCITIVCGLTPVFVTSDDLPAAILQRESGGPSKAMRRLRVGLVVVQMTSCCVLVLSTAFLVANFRAAMQTSVGHRVGQRILVTVQAEPQPQIDMRYFQHVEQAVKSIDGASVMAWTGRLPGSQPVWQSFRIEPPHLPLREITMDIARFTGESLKFFILPPKAGRLFGFGDQTCRVAVVDETAAEELFGADTVGRIVQDAAGLPVEIIGVVARNKTYVVKGRRPTIYYNYLDRNGPPTESLSHTFRAPIVSELAHVELDTNVVSSSYFNAMGLSLIAGQGLTNSRMPGECRVGAINQEAADLYFGGKPVGGAVIDVRGVRTTIIGVVRSRPFGMFQRHAEPAIYLPMRQDCFISMTLVARVRDAKGTMLRDLRSMIESLPGRGPAPVIVRTLATQLAHTALAPLRIATVILATSTTTALTLGILGLFGALNDAARQRRRELAIRMALGAQRWRIAYQVLKEGSRLACAGTLIGTLGSLAFRRLLLSVTVGNSSPPLWVWLAAPLVLALAVVIASVLPTRHASIVNPIMFLRDDN